MITTAKPNSLGDILRRQAVDEIGWFIRRARAPRLRTMRQFAEQEIVIPKGPWANRRYRCDRQPYSGLWFDAIDSGNWTRFVATGPTQSGKTLTCCVVPLMYHLFEFGEAVVFAAPDMDMLNDKWREDILPTIECSKFRDLLPLRGSGSRGGKSTSIVFRNGATLKFMSGGGSDKSRSGYTARVLVVTETDGLDESGGRSREADKITQLEARTRAYGMRKRIYLECTVSIEEGRTWREYQAGTASEIMTPCPHCHHYVKLEREHLTGWKAAHNKIEAGRLAVFACPACGSVWSDDDQRTANLAAVLVHRGQEIDDATGKISGDPPETDTLGFRWSHVNNLFSNAAEVGAAEFAASRAADGENADKAMRQFWWGLPYDPPVTDLSSLDAHAITERIARGVARGCVPTGREYLTVGVDLGMYLCHWVAIAWCRDATACIIDYGVLEVATRSLGVEVALRIALREFRDRYCEMGWAAGDGRMQPAEIWHDSGYKDTVAHEHCRESWAQPIPPTRQRRYRVTKGFGVGQHAGGGGLRYRAPRSSKSPTVAMVGEHYHIVRLRRGRNKQQQLVELDVDHWKSWLHQRLATPADRPGAMTLYDCPPHEHLTLAKHLTAEKEIQEFDPGKGMITRWKRVNRQNHYLDAAVLACAAAHLAGVRLIIEGSDADTVPPKAAQAKGAAPAPAPAKPGWFAQQRRMTRR